MANAGPLLIRYRSRVDPLLSFTVSSATPANALAQLSPDARAVARAMALWWTWRPRTAVFELMRFQGGRFPSGRAISNDGVKQAQVELRAARLLVDEPGRQGYVRLQDYARAALYRELLDDTPVDALRQALQAAVGFDPGRSPYGWPV
jgi:hypothetical protein